MRASCARLRSRSCASFSARSSGVILERFFEEGGGVVAVLGGEGGGDCATPGAGAGVEGGAAAAADAVSSEATGVAAVDAHVAVEGLPAGCAAPPFGCGESVDVDAEADADMGCAPPPAAAASNSAFSSSVSMLVVALVISFISEISPICNAEDAERQSIL